VPVNPLAQMEDIGRVVQLFPPFGQIGLDDEGARLHPRTDLMSHEPAVGEAQRGIRLEVSSKMGIKVDRVIPPHTQDTPALGLPRFLSPEPLGMVQRPGRQRDPRREASLEQIPTTHTLHDTGMSLRCFHTSLSFLSRTGEAAQQRARTRYSD
jgi:hypothetical protein